MPHNKGMDWIRLPKRMAVYHRDSFDCVWCKGVFPVDPLGYGLSLDHLDSTKGHNPANLVTCCRSCNSVKKDLTLREWYAYLASEGRNIKAIKRRIHYLTRKPINLEIGKWLAYARRPSFRREHAKELGWLTDSNPFLNMSDDDIDIDDEEINPEDYAD